MLEAFASIAMRSARNGLTVDVEVPRVARRIGMASAIDQGAEQHEEDRQRHGGRERRPSRRGQQLVEEEACGDPEGRR